MYNRNVTEKAAAQQQLLENCLLETMQTTPFDEITVRSICQQAGLSRKTFYRLFGSKEDVLHALIDQTIINYIHFDYCAAEPAPDVPPQMLQFVAYWYEQKPLLDAIAKNQMSSILLERCIQHIAQEDSSTARLFGAVGAPYAKEIILFHFSSIMCLIIYLHHKGYDHSVPEMASLIYQLLTKSSFLPSE